MEFRFRQLLRIAPTAGLVTLIQVSVMGVLGYEAGRLLGWTPMESVFTGAILSISSTTIVAKAFEEQEVNPRVRELCFGVLLAEDLMAIVLLALLTAAAAGEAFSLRSFSITGGRLLLFLTVLIAIGMCYRAVRHPGGGAAGTSRNADDQLDWNLLRLRDGGRARKLFSRAGCVSGRLAGGGVGSGRHGRASGCADS